VSFTGEISQHQLETEIAAAIRSLSRWSGVCRIWLFGSAARGAERLDWRSDLDFAVEGMSSEVHCRAWSELDEAVSLPVDLVRWEGANGLLREQIKTRGKIIYEAQPR
jgi:predicted nucleotidyltransferase